MQLADILNTRHSVRKYTDQSVERELLQAMVDAAEKAPSSRNSHSSAFMIIEDSDTIKALSEMRESGSAFMKDAPAAIIVMGDQTKTDLWECNCAISATILQLAATDLGLGSCWVHVNGRQRSKNDAAQGNAEDYVRGLLGLKENMRVLCAIAVGYEKVEEN